MLTFLAMICVRTSRKWLSKCAHTKPKLLSRTHQSTQRIPENCRLPNNTQQRSVAKQKQASECWRRACCDVPMVRTAELKYSCTYVVCRGVSRVLIRGMCPPPPMLRRFLYSSFIVCTGNISENASRTHLHKL